MNKTIISISHLYFSSVYNDFSLNIPADTNFTIAGDNGTGKTSLMKMLCNLLPLDKGTITFNDFNEKNNA
jgi:ABC-type bacteriocin/lantibiotic exporter with double-glycine peptidase domain